MESCGHPLSPCSDFQKNKGQPFLFILLYKLSERIQKKKAEKIMTGIRKVLLPRLCSNKQPQGFHKIENCIDVIGLSHRLRTTTSSLIISVFIILKNCRHVFIDKQNTFSLHDYVFQVVAILRSYRIKHCTVK